MLTITLRSAAKSFDVTEILENFQKGLVKIKNLFIVNDVVSKYVFPGMDVSSEMFTTRWQTALKNQEKWEKVARQAYKKHNAYVKATVPPNRLLVWNVKVIFRENFKKKTF